MIVIRNASARRILRVILPFVLIPAIVALGIFAVESQYHALVSFFVAVCSLLLFFCGFEKKKIGNRRLVIVAVMIALSVAGRMFPVIKPVTAFAVISGMFLGSEAGFLVGSFSALISNFYFGHGPWTPFQMLAWGLIGFFAGVLASPLKKSRLFLYFYGILAAVLFSLLMDVWSAVWLAGEFIPSLYFAKLVTSLPHTVLYAVSNVIFLILFAKPFSEKLGRIKIKYGV
ncbi:MAG: ECF transporter S component [Ruminococcaceae bacterium]|nr:ECF transporter S component [Oscillospiraceae bacterium]